MGIRNNAEDDGGGSWWLWLEKMRQNGDDRNGSKDCGDGGDAA